MVKKITNNYFQCEECSFIYKEKELAQKCEEHCKKYHSCNIEITKFALDKKEL